LARRRRSLIFRSLDRASFVRRVGIGVHHRLPFRLVPLGDGPKVARFSFLTIQFCLQLVDGVHALIHGWGKFDAERLLPQKREDIVSQPLDF
jgi:hypothetical protein